MDNSIRRPARGRGFDAIAAVHVADALVRAHVPRDADGNEHPTLDSQYVDALGIGAELPKWTAIAAEETTKWNPEGCQ